MNKTQKTVRTIGLVVMITLFTKVLGVVREALQANIFGTTQAFDLYTISYNNTIYIFTTVAYALCVAAVPIITQKLEHNREAALRTSGNLICISLFVSFILAALLSVFVQLYPVNALLGVSSDDLSALRGYLQVCLLTLPLIVLIYLLVAVFQSMEHYTLQGSLSLPYNVFLILFLALFAEKDHILEYVIAVCAAWLLQFAMTIPFIRKERFRLIPSLQFQDPDLKVFARTAVVTVFTTSIFLLCYLTDSGTVTPFGAGAVSAVYYADKLFTPVATTLIYSISVVLFPKYNQKYSRESEGEYKRYVGDTVENTLFVILPFSVMFAVFAAPVVHVLFESGSFNEESTRMTSGVFAMYSLGMAGFCVLDLINKAYYTMRKTLIPLIINAVVLGLNLIMNAVVKATGDASVVALVTACAMTVGGALALVSFFRREQDSFHIGRLLKNILSSLLMALVLYFLSDQLYHPDMSKFMTILVYCGLGVLGVAVYVASCWLLGERAAIRLILGKLAKKEN